MNQTINPDPTYQTAILHNLLHEIETLRNQRREEWHGRQHPQLKRFTQQEIVMGPCPTYQNLLIGRSLRVPDRHTINNIADYLECTLIERNQLLLSAQYVPERLEFEGTELEQARQETARLIQHMTFPAFAVDKWRIYAINDLLLKIMNMEDAKGRILRLARGPGMYFNPEVFRPNIDITPELFVDNVRDCLQLQRHTHTFFQHESWYKDLIAEAEQFQDFKPIWDTLGDTPPIKVVQIKRPLRSNRLLNIRSLSIRPFNLLYPSIVGLVPCDTQTMQYFMEVGIYMSESMLKSYDAGFVAG